MKLPVLGVLFALLFAGKTASPVRAQAIETYGSIPLAFEANEGQADSHVKFLARGPGYTVFLTARETVLFVRNPTDERATQVVKLKLARARAASAIRGLGRRVGAVNLLLGSDPAGWRVGIPTFARVEVKDVYPGVDVIYYGNQRQLQYDFVVAAGSDPRIIEQEFEGQQYGAFKGAVDQRSTVGLVLDNRLVAIDQAVIAAAELDRSVAIVTVRFEADIAAVTRNAAGEVVAGSLSDAVQTRDRWTFRRDLASRDPNWILIETDEEE